MMEPHEPEGKPLSTAIVRWVCITCDEAVYSGPDGRWYHFDKSLDPKGVSWPGST